MSVELLHRPVQWGVIGCGTIATHAVCPAIRWSKFATMAAVASRDPGRAQVLQRDLQAERWHETYDELLKDPDVEAVYIGLPNGLHHEWGIKALEAGKHVLCEKSLTLTSIEARALVELAKKKGLRLMEAFMYRHHPQWDTVRELMKSGKIGDVRLVRSGLSGQLQDTENHRWTQSLGGGALYDVTCYGLNLARYIFNREPLTVTAIADLNTRERVDQTSTAILDFGHGRVGMAAGSLSLFNHQYCEIIGSHGRILMEHPFIPGWENTRVVIQHGFDHEEVEVAGANHFLHMVEHFSLCVRDSHRPLTPGEDGLLQALLNEAVEQSWIAGKRVEVQTP